jgi:GxxExxY protein
MNNGKLLYENESYLIRGACYSLYRELGAGHKEVVYQRGLAIKLQESGFMVEREKQIPVLVSNVKVGMYVPDFVINEIILLEIKASAAFIKQDINQFWQYLRNTPYKLGFLVNFGRPGGIEIVRRVYDSAREEVQHNSA